MSVDIDLFTDAAYDSIDFSAIDGYLRQTFPYVVTTDFAAAMGRSYYVGKSLEEAIKLDLFYTDRYIRALVETKERIRLAAVEDIIAMKVEVISNGGRMKDFWDLHQLLDDYPIDRMLALHEERYPYSHNSVALK